MLIAMCGLPAAGKSALAGELARALAAPVLSVDPVEAAVWRAGVGRGEPTGVAAYAVVQTLAAENLRLGLTVVVDAVNDAAEARAAWRGLADREGVPLHFLEVRCSDPQVHRERLLGRRRDLDGFPEPTWASVEARRAAFTDWRQDRLVLDSLRPLDELTAEALDHLRRPGSSARPSP
ncbi:AAA family ATPase [Kineococcus sp. SYSU DK001]|uniref:AAA family ATPase n=1 Tax=Kineococcus sp. SYSU DK001 TaxID=3383122 RepID=UPI003D7E88C3